MQRHLRQGQDKLQAVLADSVVAEGTSAVTTDGERARTLQQRAVDSGKRAGDASAAQEARLSTVAEEIGSVEGVTRAAVGALEED